MPRSGAPDQLAPRYEAVIGVETHAQLLTRSKMFCGCSADYANAPPNTHVCPICLAMPGVLPTINRAALESAILTALALNCSVPEFCKFDRKNYTYPDLPKGYQISQYDLPFGRHGWVEIDGPAGRKRIGIRRVHLEEDTGKLLHQEQASLVDYNRAGVPLIEIVTEADLRSAEETWAYLAKLRTILRWLGVCTGNMEEGAMRCEANISLRRMNQTEFGTKVEIKNLNSFRAVRLAIAYEIERQTALLDRGEAVRQVTVGWDEASGRTVFQRSKEEAEDYRYFPEPDLPPLTFSPEWVETLRARLPELPDARRERLLRDLGLRAEDAALLTEERAVADYFEAAVAAAPPAVAPQTVANWMLGEIFRLLRERQVEIDALAATPGHLAELLGMLAAGEINATSAKEVLDAAATSGDAPRAIVARRGLAQISDEHALGELIAETLEAHSSAVQQYLEGKEGVLSFLTGQIMRATRGQANAQVVQKLLREALAKRRG